MVVPVVSELSPFCVRSQNFEHNLGEWESMSCREQSESMSECCLSVEYAAGLCCRGVAGGKIYAVYICGKAVLVKSGLALFGTGGRVEQARESE